VEAEFVQPDGLLHALRFRPVVVSFFFQRLFFSFFLFFFFFFFFFSLGKSLLISRRKSKVTYLEPDRIKTARKVVRCLLLLHRSQFRFLFDVWLLLWMFLCCWLLHLRDKAGKTKLMFGTISTQNGGPEVKMCSVSW